MIVSFILPILEKTINHYLKLDPETTQRLIGLTNKVVLQQFQPINIKIYWLFNADKIQLLDHYAGPVDVTIQGSPLSFLRFGMNTNDHSIMFKDITTTGDLDVAQDFKALFADLDIDWEEQLSHVTGDVIAHQIGNFFRAFSQWAKQSSESLQQDITEYVQEEARWLPSREEISDFLNEVDKVRDTTERLELRIERLKRNSA